MVIGMKTILLALLFDDQLGDPPNAYHPVAWMGTMIGKLRQWGDQSAVVQESTTNQFIYGGLIAGGGALVMWQIGRVLCRFFGLLPAPLAWFAEAWLLKTMFSLSGLTNAAEDVAAALQAGDLVDARRLVSWHLVSRDTSALDESQVVAATIESVGENLSDGVIAPLLGYYFFGLPAAIAYRYVNTCDAMLGYRDEAREWLGKSSARFDDMLNLIPARVTALLIVTAGMIIDGAEKGLDTAVATWQRGWLVWRNDANITSSPNAGHAMGATAGALGVSLEKVGHYELGEGLPRPEKEDIGRVVRLVRGAALLGVVVLWLSSRVRQRNS